MSKAQQESVTVWITDNHQSTGHVYHTSKDCDRLPENNKPREKATLVGPWTECRYCADDVSSNSGPKTDCPFCGEEIIMQSHLPDECGEL